MPHGSCARRRARRGRQTGRSTLVVRLRNLSWSKSSPDDYGWHSVPSQLQLPTHPTHSTINRYLLPPDGDHRTAIILIPLCTACEPRPLGLAPTLTIRWPILRTYPPSWESVNSARFWAYFPSPLKLILCQGQGLDLHTQMPQTVGT